MGLAYGDVCRVVKSGAVIIEGNKYKADDLKAYNGEKVVITLSIKNAMEKSVYTMSGKFICKAKRV
nr:MAG TPA: transposase [Caudoviricetes sp.]